LLGEYRSWASLHRGLADSTLDVRQGILVDLLRAIGDDPTAYTTETLRGFVLERARPHGVGRGKTIVSAVRAFVRYLGMTGRCSVGLAHGIPDFASWSFSSVPRFLEAEDVERVILACGGEDARGLRDRAVILLLARLGLRAGEVAHLTIADIDWKNGRLAVCGKSRRQEWLPLPQQVGDAMLAYLLRGRPRLNVPQVFISVVAPRRPLTHWAVCGIAKAALQRAGVNAPFKGSHVFRHSVATTMLRQGASLAGVGAVLRHRSPKTTLHYAKVDFGMLSEIAQPWPVPSC
jgi:integrase